MPRADAKAPVLAQKKDFFHSTQLWVGPPKIGKTSTAAAFRAVSEKYDLGIRPFFLLCEAGSEGVEVEGTWEDCKPCMGEGSYMKGKKKVKCETCGGAGAVRHVIANMEDAREWFDWFVKSKDHNVGVIDTGDGLFQIISDAVCTRMEVNSPTDVEHGIAWLNIYDDMRELLSRITGCGKAVILIHHIYMMERRKKGGGVTTVATFNVAGKTRQFLAGLADQILFFDIVPDEKGDGEKRVLIAEPQVGIEAGDRWGMFPPALDLGKSPEEAAEIMLTQWKFLKE